MKILVAVDGSRYTERMLDYLVSHGWLSQGHEITVLTVVLPLPHAAAAFASAEVVHAYYDDDAETVLRPVREQLDRGGIRARLVHEIGHPAERISQLAKSGGYDLVVMGSHGHGNLANLALGSVATKVLAGCGTPVLLVR